MIKALVLSVHLHDARWHGAGEWPPSPGRLFQALVAGVGAGGALAARHVQALCWLESLPAPAIAAPRAHPGQSFVNYVPNNDLDAVGGDPGRIGEIRAGKSLRPYLLATDPVLRFVWRFPGTGEDEAQAGVVAEIARSLYQFGRGIDMAWAIADVVTLEAADAGISACDGTVWRPAAGDAAGGVPLRCPRPGTLQSLIDRHAAQRLRIQGGLFRKPPEAAFAIVGYDCPPDRLLFELASPDSGRRFQPWPLARAVALVTAVRDRAAARLAGDRNLAERLLVGRGADEADKARRVRIVPLPSIGHTHTDPSIRRVLVERPPDCPLHADDLAWAFSGLDLGADDKTGEVLRQDQPVLAPALDRSMLRFYGVEGEAAARTWRTITPAALPVRRAAGKVGGQSRTATETEAAHAVRQALRHGGVTASVESIRVQREPFSVKGVRAEAFAAPPRFPAARLWHVQVTFDRPIQGPLVIGDGRYLGLGVMQRQAEDARDVLILGIGEATRPHLAHRVAVVVALRRALMSLARGDDGQVPTLFSGHAEGPGPAASGRHRHVFLFADDEDGDGRLDRLGVIAPWRVDRNGSPPTAGRSAFRKVVEGLRVLRAGSAGVLDLEPASAPAADDPLFAMARVWRSHTPYRPTRHARSGSDPQALARTDLALECQRRGLPKPEIEVMRAEFGPRGGIRADARLAFAVAVKGPILLGQDAHRGGGQFVACAEG